ncbi:hypothetical protein HMPREF0591_5924 [Mycobacterium parascrofulaceum ATCC BAA-614]|uniref:Uncharacterized protein n=1 Tax=Mycobacterium parascrofulaceum ATCC BAA-614 TaxID=525368 RepID=D5PIC6_9MYCO|nr:hypothetical protein HMPREF0591_5924 [Mycobacterium parascrofulaceum ATCC BAA-614]
MPESDICRDRNKRRGSPDSLDVDAVVDALNATPGGQVALLLSSSCQRARQWRQRVRGRQAANCGSSMNESRDLVALVIGRGSRVMNGHVTQPLSGFAPTQVISRSRRPILRTKPQVNRGARYWD